MAASSVKIRSALKLEFWKPIFLNFRHNSFRYFPFTCNYYSTTEKDTNKDDGIGQNEIARIRHVSQLPPWLRNRMNHVSKFNADIVENSQIPKHKHRRFLQKMYATYGRQSGINAEIMWPTDEELSEMIEIEKEWEPSLQERLEKVNKTKQEELDYIKWKEDLVDKQMKKMPEFFKQYQERLKKKEMELKKQEDKKKALLEEARDYYGYAMDSRDAKFKQLMDQKAERELEDKKRSRKQDKADKLKQRYQFMVESEKR